jgi:hypothetical protein
MVSFGVSTDKKITAEHAAAARAYDCFHFREYYSTCTTRHLCLGHDVPYLERIPRTALPSTPNPTIEAQIQELQRKGQETAAVLDWNRSVDQQMEQQQQQQGEEEEQQLPQEANNRQLDDTTTIATIPSLRN